MTCCRPLLSYSTLSPNVTATRGARAQKLLRSITAAFICRQGWSGSSSYLRARSRRRSISGLRVAASWIALRRSWGSGTAFRGQSCRASSPLTHAQSAFAPWGALEPTQPASLELKARLRDASAWTAAAARFWRVATWFGSLRASLVARSRIVLWGNASTRETL